MSVIGFSALWVETCLCLSWDVRPRRWDDALRLLCLLGILFQPIHCSCRYSILPTHWLPTALVSAHLYLIWLVGGFDWAPVWFVYPACVLHLFRGSLRMKTGRNISTKNPSSRRCRRSLRGSSSCTLTSLAKRMWRWFRTLERYLRVFSVWFLP